VTGIPGIQDSLLKEFGVRRIAYDLPSIGESDPHPSRDLNSSALDIVHLANTLGVVEKFWVLGYSGGAKHAWAAPRYIPDKIAGNLLLQSLVV
jgi:pimeloyl-ACP methyl ester carboxylesterase